MDPLDAMPEAFAAGTTIKLQREHGDFPADDGWSLQLYLAGPQVLTVTGVANGAAFDLTITAAATAGFPPGVYRWVERASKAGEVYDAASGLVTIMRNLATAAANDALTFAEKNLAVVEAALSGTLTQGMQSYQIAGRAVSRIPIEELMKLRNQLAWEVQRLRSGGRVGRRYVVVFRPPGMA